MTHDCLKALNIVCDWRDLRVDHQSQQMSSGEQRTHTVMLFPITSGASRACKHMHMKTLLCCTMIVTVAMALMAPSTDQGLIMRH